MPPQFTPESVFNLINGNPQAMSFVENLAKMNGLQSQVNQFMPPNPYQSNINPYSHNNTGGNNHWAPPPQQQMQPSNQPTTDIQNQGGQSNMNPLDMAMGIVDEFRKKFKALDENLKLMYDRQDILIKENETLREEVKKLMEDLGASK